MSSILITGGAGYIGSHFVALWREMGGNCVVLDNLSRGHKSLLLDAELVVGDVGDAALVASICRERDVDVAVHFAAFAYVGESHVDPARYYENNVMAGLRFLDGLRRAKVGKVVFSSSCATYGDVGVGCRITESTLQKPVNPYGRTKLMFEEILRDYDASYGLKSIALRYFNAAGCSTAYPLFELHDPETHLIPLAIQAAVTGSTFKIFGNDYPTSDGTCVRDFIHVDDLAKAHAAAVHALRNGSPTMQVNLGSGCGVSVRKLLSCIERVVGMPILIENVARRSGDPPFLVASTDLAAHVLAWRSKYATIEQIVKTAYSGFLTGRAKRSECGTT
jgi:UDP-glucose 4-epimerase